MNLTQNSEKLVFKSTQSAAAAGQAKQRRAELGKMQTITTIK
jgi:hypothetical protein